MTETELSEAVGLLARWKHRNELKLPASERFWIKYRLEDLGLRLDPEPVPIFA